MKCIVIRWMLLFLLWRLINFSGIAVLPPGRVPETNTMAKLPKVKLPTFSRCVDKHDRFITMFKTIINKHDPPSYEKYVYFKGQMMCLGKVLTDSLPLNGATYKSAKKLLSDANCDVTTQ